MIEDTKEIRPVRGTRDLIGAEADTFCHIIEVLKNMSEIYGYKFVETPIIEHTEIFKRSIGEETDVVGKEMFSFFDKSENSLSLRPEGTASAVRAFISNKLTQIVPQKWFYHGPMFRYDRPQKGRYRQFYQFGLEYFGSNDPLSDVEIIALAKNTLRKFGIWDVSLSINSVGDKESREKYKNRLVEYYKKYDKELSEDSIRRLKTNPLRILDSKDLTDKKINETAPKIIEYLNDESKKFFDSVLEHLNSIGIFYDIDHTLVRGLDYYDHTAFEFKAKLPGTSDRSAICGGGRYNGLISQFGGPEIPAVGLAFGIDRLMLLCDQKNIEQNNSIAVLYVGESEKNAALKIAQEIRNTVKSTQILLPLQTNLSKKLKYCDKQNVKCVFIIGEDEVKENVVKYRFLTKFKNFEQGHEGNLSREKVCDFVTETFCTL